MRAQLLLAVNCCVLASCANECRVAGPKVKVFECNGVDIPSWILGMG